MLCNVRREFITRNQDKKGPINNGSFFQWEPQYKTTRNGGRLIKGFVSANRFHAVCDDLDRRFPHYKGRVFPFCAGLWHDGVAMTFRLSAHPVLLFMLNICDEFLQCDINKIRMGTTCPALNKRFWPKGAGNLNSFKNLTSYALHQSLDLIMEQFWLLNRTGFVVKNFRKDSGEYLPEALIVTYLPLVNVDLEQAWKDQGVRACGTRSHLTLLATRDDFDDPLVRTYPTSK